MVGNSQLYDTFINGCLDHDFHGGIGIVGISGMGMITYIIYFVLSITTQLYHEDEVRDKFMTV